MRIAIHDYAGHPAPLELSRHLALQGHVVRHFFFEGDPGPKGSFEPGPADPEGFDVKAIQISSPYRKSQLLKRRSQDIEYGRNAGAAIAEFRPDVVLSGNTPLEAQGLIMAAARRVGSAFIFWMQDFYSVAVRELLGGRLMGAGSLAGYLYQRIEASLLMRSEAVVIISDGFLGGLRQLKVPLNNVSIIPNWGIVDKIPYLAKGDAENLTFLYSGTLGLKHDPELLLSLADEFANDDGVRIVVAAVGAGADQLKFQLASRPRQNLVMKDLEPIANLPRSLSDADVLVAILEEDAGHYSVPSKILSYLCAGRPVLLSAPLDNLAARTIRQAGAGNVVKAGDRKGLLSAARELRRSHKRRHTLGAAGRAFAEAEFDIASISRKFMAVFEQAIEARRSRTIADAA